MKILSMRFVIILIACEIGMLLLAEHLKAQLMAGAPITSNVVGLLFAFGGLVLALVIQSALPPEG